MKRTSNEEKYKIYLIKEIQDHQKKLEKLIGIIQDKSQRGLYLNGGDIAGLELTTAFLKNTTDMLIEY
ncbi:MAG TPA: hypothetical protein ENH82_15790 [bacterium]|nr:hypothetical protein [bacterium]